MLVKTANETYINPTLQTETNTCSKKLKENVCSLKALLEMLEPDAAPLNHKSVFLRSSLFTLKDLYDDFGEFSSNISLLPQEKYMATHFALLISEFLNPLETMLVQELYYEDNKLVEGYQHVKDDFTSALKKAALYFNFVDSFTLMSAATQSDLMHLTYCSEYLKEAFLSQELSLHLPTQDSALQNPKDFADKMIALGNLTNVFHQFLCQIPQNAPEKQHLTQIFQNLFDCSFKAKFWIINCSLDKKSFKKRL